MEEAGSANGIDAPVIIIGGGPTGLSLALGLARHKIRSILLEKKAHISEHSKAPVLHVRTCEILKQWGAYEAMYEAGNLVEKLSVKTPREDKILFSLDFTELKEEAHKPGMLILKQSKIEKILLASLKETNYCDLNFNSEVAEILYEKDHCTVKVKTPNGEKHLTSRFCVGCDGASSFTRDSLGFSFDGKTYNVNTVLADVKIKDSRNKQSWPRFYNGNREITVAIQISPGFWRLIHLESGVKGEKEKEEEIPRGKIDKWVRETIGQGDFEMVWASPFKIHRRATQKFRKGNILLAGDAAHVHSPVGGQGMNAGIQDSHNLAWKLAVIFSGGKQEKLLNSFETERKAVVVDKVSGYTDLITRTFLQTPKLLRSASFFFLRRILSIPFLRSKFIRNTTMINLGYYKSEIQIASKDPAGMRLPNVVLNSVEGKRVRLYDLLSIGINILSFKAEWEIESALTVIKIGKDHYEDPSGRLEKLVSQKGGWIVVRPDLHIAWTGNHPEELKRAVSLLRGES